MQSERPQGFVYRPELVSETEEQHLIESLRSLAFSEVKLRGMVARRRVAHFGWLYDYESWRIAPGPPIPDFLLPLRARAAGLAALDPDVLVEVLLTEYPAGAGIGWHRDAPRFGVVIGVSLLGECRFRFQRGAGRDRRTWSVVMAPRSAYVLDGDARYAWQHGIPPARSPRYSVTFRPLRQDHGERERPVRSSGCSASSAPEPTA